MALLLGARYWAERAISREAARFQETLAASNFRVAHDAITVDGLLPPRIKLGTVEIVSKGGFRLRLPDVTATPGLFDSNKVQLTSPGPLSIGPPDEARFALIVDGPVSLLVAGFAAGSREQSVSVSFSHPVIGEPEGLPFLQADKAAITLSVQKKPPADRTLPTASITLTLDQLAKADPPPPPGATPGAAPPAPLSPKLSGHIAFVHKGPLLDASETVAQWRDAGGLLEISKGEISIGATSLSVTGFATVDEQLRLKGKAVAELRNFDALAQILTASDPSSAREIAFAAIFLGVVAGISGDDARQSDITLPILAENGLLKIKDKQVARLPPLDIR